MSELGRGRFSVTANVNHGGRVCTAKVFDKSDPEGEDAARREFKNLKSIRHERLVSFWEVRYVLLRARWKYVLSSTTMHFLSLRKSRGIYPIATSVRAYFGHSSKLLT